MFQFINIFKFFLAMSLLSPLCLIRAEDSDKTFIHSTFLSPKVSGAFVQTSEEEMGLVLYGNVEGQEGVLKLGKILTMFSDSDTQVNIEEVSTEEKARGLGVATALYEFVIKQSEKSSGKKVTHLAGTSKVGTNREVVLKALMESLKDKGGFIEPTKDAEIQTQFKECCSKIYSSYPELILASVKESPTAKIGKKLGFEVDPESVEFLVDELDGKTNIQINYIQVRK